MPDLFGLSSKIIDSGVLSEPPNRITRELSEVIDGVAVVEAFSHVWAFDTGAGLVLFDASSAVHGAAALASLRQWRTDRVDTLVYTHGHLDHVGGSGAILVEAEERGFARPDVVAHAAVQERFDRYRYTNGWNLAINIRQFGRFAGMELGGDNLFLPDDVAEPTIVHAAGTALTVGDLTFELHHARGETDDHTWAWVPDRRAVVVGDLFIWNFPNAGNPQKVQRHAGEWATALRRMADKRPEYLLPAHGLPVEGEDRVGSALAGTAEALEHLERETVAMMNEGATLDAILHAVRVPDHLAELPYIQPLYDEPEFVVRNIYRLYGGWWDGDPASLKPAPRAALAAEMAALAGGPLALAERAAEVADTGDLRLACHLAQMAGDAAPDDPAVHEIRRDVYRARRAEATSLMARGIYGSAIAESKAVVGE